MDTSPDQIDDQGEWIKFPLFCLFVCLFLFLCLLHIIILMVEVGNENSFFVTQPCTIPSYSF